MTVIVPPDVEAQLQTLAAQYQIRPEVAAGIILGAGVGVVMMGARVADALAQLEEQNKTKPS